MGSTLSLLVDGRKQATSTAIEQEPKIADVSGHLPSEPACFDKEGTVPIDYHRYVLALLCGKEPVIDGLPGYHLAFLTSS